MKFFSGLLLLHGVCTNITLYMCAVVITLLNIEMLDEDMSTFANFVIRCDKLILHNCYDNCYDTIRSLFSHLQEAYSGVHVYFFE